MNAWSILMLNETPIKAKLMTTSQGLRLVIAFIRHQLASSRKNCSVASMLFVRESATTMGVKVSANAAKRAAQTLKRGLIML